MENMEYKGLQDKLSESDLLKIYTNPVLPPQTDSYFLLLYNSIQPFKSLLPEACPFPRYLKSIVWSISETPNKYEMNKWMNK